MEDMHTSQVSDNHRMKELEKVVPGVRNMPNLIQLFSLDLDHCPIMPEPCAPPPELWPLLELWPPLDPELDVDGPACR